MEMTNSDIQNIKLACVETEEVLKYLKKEDYEKIPQDFLDTIHKNKDENYTWQYDTSKTLAKQNFNEYTMVLLALINNNYLLSKEKRELMDKIYENNDKLTKSNIESNNNLPMVQKEKWYNRIFRKIMGIFKKK